MSIEKVNPVPQGKYVPATRFGQLIFTAGMTPRVNGVLMMVGPVKVNEPLENYREAVYRAASNAFVAAQNLLQDGERIAKVLSLSVYVNAEDGFTAHSKIADFATDYLCEELGQAGVAARAALGMASLPGNAPVEIQIICAVE